MPQAINLSILNAAAVAKTFTLLNPSAGVNSAALWELQEGAHSGVFPKLSAVTRPDTSAAKSKPGSASVLKLMLPQAVTDSTTGLVSAGSDAECIITVKMKHDFPEALKADFVAYIKNVVANSDVQTFLKGRTSFT